MLVPTSLSLALLAVEEFPVADSLASALLQSSIYSSAAILHADDVGVSVLSRSSPPSSVQYFDVDVEFIERLAGYKSDWYIQINYYMA